MTSLRLAGLVLAAGAGSRFSSRPGGKLLADLDGLPLLEHVLAAVRAFEPVATVVVLGHGVADVERTISWRGEIRVVNRTPEHGLASSLQVGIRALEALPGPIDGTFIALGDQPRIRPQVMRALADAAVSGAPGVATHATATSADREARPIDGRPAACPILVPRYRDAPGPRNPVLLLRAAWGLVHELEGDRGLAPLMDSGRTSVIEVPVDGTMPDVDELADLAQLRDDSSPAAG